MKKISNIIAAILLLVMIPGAIYLSYREGLFLVRTIEVVNEEAQLPEAYLDYVQNLKQSLKAFEKQPIWDVSVEKMSKLISEQSWIVQFEIRRRIPDMILIEIVTKPPVAMALDSRDALRLVASDGDLLPPIEKTKSLKLPVIQDKKLWQTPEFRRRLVKILSQLPTDGQLELSQISEVGLDDKNEIWMTHLKTKSKIKLGEDQIPLRVARVSKVLEYLDQNNLSWRVIEADYNKKVLVRLRNGR